MVVDLPLPDFERRQEILSRALGRLAISEQPSAAAVAAIALAFDGESGAGLERFVNQAARAAIVGGTPLPKTFLSLAVERLDPRAHLATNAQPLRRLPPMSLE